MASDLLVGWKCIAAHVRMSERGAQMAVTWEPPIPVRHLGGRRSALAAELDAWLAKSPKAPAKVPLLSTSDRPRASA